jgi:hypothetical protein
MEIPTARPFFIVLPDKKNIADKHTLIRMSSQCQNCIETLALIKKPMERKQQSLGWIPLPSHGHLLYSVGTGRRSPGCGRRASQGKSQIFAGALCPAPSFHKTCSRSNHRRPPQGGIAVTILAYLLQTGGWALGENWDDVQ